MWEKHELSGKTKSCYFSLKRWTFFFLFYNLNLYCTLAWWYMPVIPSYSRGRDRSSETAWAKSNQDPHLNKQADPGGTHVILATLGGIGRRIAVGGQPWAESASPYLKNN
jgi:hypothetical protein